MKQNNTTPRQALIAFLIVLMAILHSLTAGAQTIRQDSKGNYYTVKAEQADKGKATGKTLTLTTGEVFPVMESKNGKLYVIRTSKKTGSQYKQYLKIK